ncbi:MAG: hypothetical protein IKJ82_01090 [Oscillospiraceae bacterium]|nr:hypothetical protein [Oscillospiraceae bacterium]
MTERYSDFNSMIERYEKEMRRLFEEKQRMAGFEEPSGAAAVFPEDAPEMPQYGEKEQAQDYAAALENPVPRGEENSSSEKDITDKTGTLIAEVSTAKGAVPLSGVSVIIDRLDTEDSKGRKELIAIEITNQSGRTSPVKVKAEPKELSLEPGNIDPFRTVYVSAKADGFEPAKNLPVDIFADEISILKIDLVPKPENLSGSGVGKW